MRMRFWGILAFVMVTVTSVFAQQNDAKYLAAGAVPVTAEGRVEFVDTIAATGKTQAELYELMKTYVENDIVNGPEHLPQARITQLTPEEGLIVASIEENLWFKRKAFVSDFSRFFYQLIFETKDGEVKITMRNLHYLYDNTEQTDKYASFRAEEWITDKEAIHRSGTKLKKITGKFRRATIDRKDAIFEGAEKVVVK